MIAGLALRDDDRAPLALAVTLADMTDAPLVLIHVRHAQPSTGAAPAPWRDDGRDGVRERLDAIAAAMASRGGVRVQARDAPSPVRALHEAAEELGASVLVTGRPERRGGATHTGVGERLLHAAPCAVAIAPPAYGPGAPAIRRIGVAFNDGPEARDALAVAAGLARSAGAALTIHTVLGARHARERVAVARATGPSPVERRAAMLDRLHGAVAPELLAGVEVLEGDAAEQLAAVSSELDLLICGSRGYGPVRSEVVGGVSSHLAQTAVCPLIVIPRAAVPSIATLTGRGAGPADG